MVLFLVTQMVHPGTHLSAQECRIPVMIVGMPGTGKTLAVNIATSVLRGSNSMPFFRDFCDVANSVFRYQCLGMPWMILDDSMSSVFIWNDIGLPWKFSLEAPMSMSSWPYIFHVHLIPSLLRFLQCSSSFSFKFTKKKSHWIVQGKKQRKPIYIYIMDFHGEKPWFPVKMFPSTNPVMKF